MLKMRERGSGYDHNNQVLEMTAIHAKNLGDIWLFSAIFRFVRVAAFPAPDNNSLVNK
jgi:hypothetical protein